MMQMRTMIFVCGTLLLSLTAMEQGALAEAVKTEGDLRVTGAVDNEGGSGIIFPDGSTQTKACSACANGVLSISLGGTGTSVAPATAGQFLRSISAGYWGVSGIQAGDIPSLSGQYVDISGAQTVTGVKTFNPSSGSVPFAINSSKTGTIANLNAEMVGGNRLSDLDLRYGQRPVAQLPRTNTITTLESTGDVGRYPAITIGSDGLPIITHNNANYRVLKVVHCSDALCSSATSSTPDSASSVGRFTSITIGRDGLPIISYQDYMDIDLKVAHCLDVKCTSADTATLDSSDSVGWYTSITIGSDGLAIITYYDDTNHNLKVAHCSNVACSGANTTILDSTDDVGKYTSIAIGSDGLPVISYYDQTNYNLKVVHCTNVTCTSADTPVTLDSAGSVGSYSSITIGSDGLPIISYFDSGNTALKVAHCANVSCTSADTLTTLDSNGTVGEYNSITIGGDCLPVISYYDSTNGNLKVAHCTNVLCSAAVTNTVDSDGEVGYYSSITIGSDGLPVISYWDLTNYDLKAVKCANQFCVNYLARR